MASSNSSRPTTENLPDVPHRSGQAAGSRPGVELLGRAHELELIEALLAPGGRDRCCLLLRGDPGVGKTALLDAAAARAEAADMRVLRTSGVDFEAELNFSALHQLLYPLREQTGRLAAAHREVIDQVIELVPGPPHPLAVSPAVLALLSGLAAERPLLLLVDDVRWIDQASATVLGFMARRITDAPIALLAAGRTGTDGFFDRVGLAEWEVGPLTDGPAATLLDTWYPGLTRSVRRRVLAEAAGNPLALRELPAALTDRQLSGQDPMPAFLPLSRPLKGAFAAQAGTLPAPTRQLLLMAALEADASPATLRTAAHSSPSIDHLALAQQAGLVHADAATGPMTFRHPLIRSAIAQLSSPEEHRAAHQALADALTGDPERRAWHLAETATGPDEVVAQELDKAALAVWRRRAPFGAGANATDGAAVADHHGGASAAVTALVRAAELSPGQANRSRRLVEAAYLATAAGQLDQVPRLLTDAGQAPDTSTGLVFAATAYLLTAGRGELDAAHRLLARALDNAADTDPTDNWDYHGILYALLIVSIYSDRPEPWALLRSALDRFDPETVTPFRLCYDAYADAVRSSGTLQAGIARALVALPADAAPWQIIPLTYAAVGLDVLSEFRYLVWRMVNHEREGGAAVMVAVGLLMLCLDSYAQGRWDETEDLARQGLDLTAVHGYQLIEGQLRAQLARIAAVRGDADLTHALTDQVTSWAAPREIRMTQAYANHARALAALGQGNFEEAYLQASRTSPPDAPNLGVPGRWMILDLVEAAVRTGRTAEARAHVAAAQRAGLDRISSRTALITAGAAAVAADDREAGPLFEAALSLPESERWPFELARIHLAYGQLLRRTRDTTQARLHLHTAVEILDRLGATPWAQRARNELRATGLAAAHGPGTHSVTLTTQERQIATLAAAGMTNKEIAQRLFLSHRTVGNHLHRIFPKLGITSRAALRDALEAIRDDEDEQTERRH